MLAAVDIRGQWWDADLPPSRRVAGAAWMPRGALVGSARVPAQAAAGLGASASVGWQANESSACSQTSRRIRTSG